MAPIRHTVYKYGRDTAAVAAAAAVKSRGCIGKYKHVATLICAISEYRSWSEANYDNTMTGSRDLAPVADSQKSHQQNTKGEPHEESNGLGFLMDNGPAMASGFPFSRVPIFTAEYCAIIDSRRILGSARSA